MSGRKPLDPTTYVRLILNHMMMAMVRPNSHFVVLWGIRYSGNHRVGSMVEIVCQMRENGCCVGVRTFRICA